MRVHWMAIIMTAFLLSASAAADAAPAETEVKKSIIILKSGDAEYHFENGKSFHLKNASYKGKPLSIQKLALTYLIHNENWHWEESPHADYKMGTYQYRIEKNATSASLIVTAEGPMMKLSRTFTLHHDNPALDVSIRLEISGENKIDWVNLFTVPVPLDSHLIRFVTREENGVPASRIQRFPNPFLDGNGNFVSLGNFEQREWSSLPLAGSYDPENDRGTLFIIQPEKSQWLFRLGQNADKKSRYLGISPSRFSSKDENHSDLYTAFKIIPFSGKPENLQESVAVPLIKSLKKYHLIPEHYETGEVLSDEADFVLWQELPDNKVFRNQKHPSKTNKTVTLYAARGETESFQLVVTPRKEMQNVSLKMNPLRSGSNEIPASEITWNPIGYRTAAIPWNSSLEVLGEQPDILLDAMKTKCFQGISQPFFVTVKVPSQTPAGTYEGKIDLLSGNKVLVQIPLKVRVWSFSVADQTLTAALDFWWRNQKYSQDKQATVQNAVEKMVVDHRGGARWVTNPTAQWDEKGNLLSVDFTLFDKSMEKFIKEYKHRIIIVRTFMLGYGHVPQKNFFGTEKEILSELWKKKLLQFAQKISIHLKEKGWNDYVVFDLFDEPYNQYASMIDETVKLLRTVNPSWRFTLAGNYNPLFKDSINYWNLTMRSCSPSIAEKIRKAGGTVTVYNPPGYEYTQPLTLIRGNYWWLWKNRIDYIYQWVVNCWSEHGYTGWDDYACASWLAPGPNGPLSTLRLAATRDGIEDYEYLKLLRKMIPEVRKINPDLAKQGNLLLEKVSEAVWTTPNEEIVVLASQNPAIFHHLHKEMGELLDKMNSQPK